MPPFTPSPYRASKKRSFEFEHESTPKKRRAQQTPQNNHSNTYRTEVIDLTRDSPEPYTLPPISPSSKGKRTAKTPQSSQSSRYNVEKRRRRFRSSPPQTYLEKLHRATTQRMFVISRRRVENGDIIEENVDIVGTTGNIYTVTVSYEPRCTCPDARKGNQCKHIIYVLVNVLKARADLRYQLAFLSEELREMFENAPIEPEEAHADKDSDTSGKRKPIEGDCPICFMEFEPETEKIVWCKVGCGNNIHKTCFDQWVATTRNQGVRCVLCRTDWPADAGASLDMTSLLGRAKAGEDGYLNVASAVGLSGDRDYSTYNSFWVRNSRRRGGRYWGSDYYGDY